MSYTLKKRADKWGKRSKYTDFFGNFGENMPATGSNIWQDLG